MSVMYHSTRSDMAPVTASQAILMGLAPDGGLFVPDSIPAFTASLEEMTGMTYQELAFSVMRPWISDFTDQELMDCVKAAYDEKFDTPAIAPLLEKDGAWYLELFHGSTIAFKDMALSILPHLMVTSARKNNVHDKIVILTATSGDTGKAAMAGFADVPGTEIIVFFPHGGVSNIQRLQMVTQKGENTHVAAIRGNFDDAQTAVKEIFNDRAFGEEMAKSSCRFSSANSINIGRLVPQIVYYVYAYCQMVKLSAVKVGEPINITVPTGNFGNILAAYYAKCMGLPVNRLICASNENKVLFDFFQSGCYNKKRDFILTTSPSMDILVSSNLERLIYRIVGEKPEVCAALMRSLSGEGHYEITEEMKEKAADFVGGFATEEENFAGIKALYEKTGYVIDTHTGIANAVYRSYVASTGDTTPCVIASTASPYKFSGAVMKAIAPETAEQVLAKAAEEGADPDFALIDKLTELSGVAEPGAVTEIRTAPIRHTTVADIQEMRDVIRKFVL